MTTKNINFSAITKKVIRCKVGVVALAVASVLSLSACAGDSAVTVKSPTTVKAQNKLISATAAKPYVPSNRVAAEWEPALGALVGWPLALPEKLIVDIAKKDLLFVVLGSEEEADKALEKFIELGIEEDNLRFVVHPNANSENFAASAGPQWTRDWGPFSQFTKEGEHYLADPLFSGYPLGSADCDGKLDTTTLYTEYEENDEVVEELAAQLETDSNVIPLHITGGNIMFDGKGTAMITCLTVKENEHNGISQQELKTQLKELLGVDTFHIIPNFEDYGIQHIDCLLKFVSEDTVLIAKPPKSSHLYERYEEIVKIVSKLKTNSGLSYKILRIDAGETNVEGEKGIAAYTNSLILNNRVFVPLFGIDTDKAALETWRKALPGYEVSGYEYTEAMNPGNPNPFRSFDALHCRTRAVWDPEMLFMTHNQLTNTVASQAKHSINVSIKDYSNYGLVEESLMLKWRVVGADAWNDVALKRSSTNSIYTADIAGAKSGETIEYYMTAEDYSGREEFLPRSAPAAFYTFKVGAK